MRWNLELISLIQQMDIRQGQARNILVRQSSKNIARDQVVIASKVYFNEGRLSQKAIMREIEGTLQRLGTDYLDLYIIHRFDYDTPIEETMEALHDLVKAGKSKSNWCICNVWLPVLQYAAYSKRTWLDTIFCNGESL